MYFQKKKKQTLQESLLYSVSLKLSFLYVSSLRSTLALLNFKSYFLTFVKRFETFALDS